MMFRIKAFGLFLFLFLPLCVNFPSFYQIASAFWLVLLLPVLVYEIWTGKKPSNWFSFGKECCEN